MKFQKGHTPWNKDKISTSLGVATGSQVDRDYSHLKNNVDVDKHSLPVLCIETGEVFPSISDAARAVSENEGAFKNISAVCKGKRATAYGFHWEYATDKRYEDTLTKVRCIETGEVFTTVTEAQKHIGALSSSTLWYATHDGSMAGGYHWELVA